MPLYEYKCDGCGKTFEVIQKFVDDPLTVHEECGGAVRRLLSSPALQFKGSGWYVNDYAKSGSGSRSKAEGESKSESKSDSKTSDSSSTSSSTSESKPATAPSTSSSSDKK